MYHVTHIGWEALEADRAFTKVVRARRRASLMRRGLRRCAQCARLAVRQPQAGRGAAAGRGVRDIPLDAIVGTVEPNRAADFDCDFRPSRRLRSRWLAVWLAEHRGAGLPPISVTATGDGYAIRDGHHRVSVARARGALTIAAVVS
jgi:hypothetical protein